MSKGKTRWVQTGVSKLLQGSGATPCRGGAWCPAPLSMGGECHHANLFCGSSYPAAWRTQSVNPLSLPGHKCARCNKDYGGGGYLRRTEMKFLILHMSFNGGGRYLNQIHKITNSTSSSFGVRSKFAVFSTSEGTGF